MINPLHLDCTFWRDVVSKSSQQLFRTFFLILSFADNYNERIHLVYSCTMRRMTSEQMPGVKARRTRVFQKKKSRLITRWNNSHNSYKLGLPIASYESLRNWKHIISPEVKTMYQLTLVLTNPQYTLMI